MFNAFNLFSVQMGLNTEGKLSLVRRFIGEGRAYEGPDGVIFEFETAERRRGECADGSGLYTSPKDIEHLLIDRDDPFQAPAISEAEFFYEGRSAIGHGKSMILHMLEVLLRVAEKGI